MLTAADLKALARARVADAKALLQASRFGEFRRLETFKTHDLDILLRLSGREQYIKVNLFAEWTVVSQWNPESRYRPVGTVSVATAQGMISAAQKILAKL